MGQKKIKYLMILIVLFSIQVYSQELQWREKNELTRALYLSLDNYVNEETNTELKLPNILKVGPFEYLYDVLTRKKREQQYAEQKQIEQIKQQEAKTFLKSHFIINDSIVELVFQNKEQILEWSEIMWGAFSVIRPEDIYIKNHNIFILMIDGWCSDRCLGIDIFKQEDTNWKLITSTGTNIREQFVINIDDDGGKIIFQTKSDKIISELPFDLLLSSD